MAELTTPSLANMRSMMAELFVWKEKEKVLREGEKKTNGKLAISHHFPDWMQRAPILWHVVRDPQCSSLTG